MEFLYSSTPNSLNTINKNSFLVYPNPAHDKLFIKGLKNGMEVKLFDVAGRVIIIKEMTAYYFFSFLFHHLSRLQAN